MTFSRSDTPPPGSVAQPASPRQSVTPAGAVWKAPTPRKPVSAAFVIGTIALCVLSFLFLLVLGYVMLSIGPTAALVCGVIALIPLTVVLLVVRLIDRWEPEPRGALWFAFLWGAAASVALALLVDAGVQILVYAASDGQAVPSDVFGAVIQAPLVEESAKGFGVLLIFLVLRRTFDGPVDGLVYAATVAGGFAFTENILYFGSSLIEGGGVSLGVTFALRGIMGPFAHVMFTSCTGIALGFASRRRGFWPVAGLFLLGLLCAMILHALWNGTTVVADGIEGFLAAYAVIQVPLFALAIVGVVLLRRAEVRATRARLAEYAAAGWFVPAEVDMLATGQGRRSARAWARSQPVPKTAVMRAFIRDATALAFTRQRLITGRDHIGIQRQEAELLAAVASDRAALLSG
ncbi:PrsW family intramembrane metalloprotease [Subtercola boreus]|uniref:PrsW family intramembrane metalloprotease n=1 Tax=Subtercola boreus TaxID=120213 RepID=A0A3E0WCN9_9MICO|nr:PrsW family intramembrane metalloprotease [Subtercola boreus]RFA20624.1 hypothetical protein B7R24_09345 [Subtercola boreus]RFA20738.1 hypothetical protein B7R23_09280 [Subtercola boreus]RFA26949.1 hypothetical protein B7R25_09410 [Subtercola boreus]